MRKRFKVEIEGIQRVDEMLTEKEAQNKLRHKFLRDMIAQTDEIIISIGNENNPEKKYRPSKEELLDSCKEFSFELLMCPYCGARLNRVDGLLPTSCHECDRQRFKPKVLNVINISQFK